MTWRRRSFLGAGITLASAGVIRRAAAGMPRMALTMATGEPGGGFALYGPAWGQSASATAPVTLSYRASGGSAANILLVEQGAAQLGLTTLAVADQAWLGNASWTGRVTLRGFRALFPIFPASWQVIALLEGPVKRLADLTGRPIGVGPAGGASAVLTPALLAAAHITPNLAITGLYTEQIELLLRRKLDACAFFGPTPLPALRDAAGKGGFILLGVTKAQQTAMARLPGMGRTIIPHASLPHQTAAVSTIGSDAIAIGRADLPDQLVAQLTEAALSDQGAMRATGLPPDAMTIKNGWIDASSPVLIHPGAAMALRRHGFAAPARLVRS
ncbi:TAXI family TRAP transporter solute-binding subunit [Acidiphilium sp. PA]|uniref:TAXI family TRAP transporter solute-binding subunit n=1 Tax=Acidiphilium sp. PA TaxID=2871705 RepID=UPI002243E098|nr:TAXI family TRAP transporter solute-binding subunit [Acidiphilium sp. PA]MCW8307535.1 TAXI family TRAP transporter solute-binding subunit [Acidiphilium sp. PA]